MNDLTPEELCEVLTTIAMLCQSRKWGSRAHKIDRIREAMTTRVATRRSEPTFEKPWGLAYLWPG